MEPQNNAKIYVKLFGTIQVWVDNVPISEKQWRGQKNPLFLARLLVNRGHAISIEKLVEDFYPDSSFENARKNIWSRLVDVRNILEPDIEKSNQSHFIVRSSKGSYQFVADPGCVVDIEQFEREIREATAHFRRENWSGARGGFDRALELYGGEFLEEFPYVDWTHDARTHYRTLFIEATANAAECAFRLKDHAAAIEHCTRALSLDPYREAIYHQLMRYYAYGGEREKAIEIYEQYILQLEKAGRSPSEKLKQLLAQIRAGTLLEPTQKVPTNLPHPLTSFIGRKPEIRSLADLLSSEHAEGAPRIITLTGPGGSGKTRLAIQVARQVETAFPEGIWWIDLAPLQQSEDMAAKILRTLGLRESQTKSNEAQLTERIQNRHMLLILDNCEHLVDETARLIDNLLLQCGNLKILTTSRIWLRVAGEQIYEVSPMELPQDSHTTLSQDSFDSIRLFVERARLRDRNFRPDERELELITQICRALDGIPLNIEMAAALVGEVSLSELERRVGARLLDQPSATRMSLQRHESPRASVDWSFNLLSQYERELLYALSVFRGGWKLSVLDPLSNHLATTEARSLTIHASLVQKSLIQPAESLVDSQRFNMLETIRQHAEEKLSEQLSKSANQAQLQYVQEFTAAAEPEMELGSDPSIWFGRVDDELSNIRSALEWALNSDQSSQALNIAVHLGRYWVSHGHLREGLRWLEKILARGPFNQNLILAKALNLTGVLFTWMGQYHSAMPYLERAIELSESIGELKQAAYAIQNMGVVYKKTGAFRKAKEFYEKGLKICRKLEDRHGEAMMLNALGLTLLAHEKFGESRQYLEESLNIKRELNEKLSIAISLNNLGLLALHEQKYERAVELFEEALNIRVQMGDKYADGNSRCNVGLAQILNGALESGYQNLREGLILRVEMDNLLGISTALTYFAEFYHIKGDLELAAQLLGAAQAILEEMDGVLDYVPEQMRVRATAELTEELGEETFQREFEAGGQLPTKRATELALYQDDTRISPSL